MNIDPRRSADYLAAVALDDRRVVGDLLDHLRDRPDPRGEGLHLHQLRILAARKLGEAEGRVFERIALDQQRPGPVRSWAWNALAGTPRVQARTLMDAADAESDPGVRRAIVLGLRGLRVNRQRSAFLRAMERRDPDLRFAGRWLEEAA
jgi:hypothetical protein